MSTQRILIIDDEEAIRFALRDILEYENYTIDEAESAAKALTIRRASEADKKTIRFINHSNKILT